MRKGVKENNELYQQNMKESIEGYFTNPKLLTELNTIFSDAVLKYISTQGFENIVNKSAEDAMTMFLTEKFKAGLENNDEAIQKKYKEICEAAKKKQDNTNLKDIIELSGGRRTKSTRKPRKRTIKRRR
jgi:hypothetical protein